MNTDKKREVVSLKGMEEIYPRIAKVAANNKLSTSDAARMMITIGLEYFEQLGPRRIIDVIVARRGESATAASETAESRNPAAVGGRDPLIRSQML